MQTFLPLNISRQNQICLRAPFCFHFCALNVFIDNMTHTHTQNFYSTCFKDLALYKVINVSRVIDNKKPLSAEENNNLPSDEEDENSRDRDVDKASTASGDSGSFSEPELPLEELARLSIKSEGTLTARSPMYGSVTKNHRIDPYNGVSTI